MSRELKSANKYFFEKFQAKADIQDPFVDKRYIYFDEIEKDKYTKSKIKSKLFPVFGSSFVLISWKENNYLIEVGDSNASFHSESMREEKLTPGFFLLIVEELNLPIINKKTTDYIREYIMYEIQDLSSYNGVINDDLYYLTDCFPPINVFLLNETIDDYETRNYKACIDYYCSNKRTLFLDFHEDSLKLYIDLLNSGNDEIPLDNLLRSIISTHWRYCFLDLYRCIERLYVLARAHEIQTSFSSNLDLKGIIPVIAEKIQKNPQEEQSLRHLFSLISQSFFEIIKDCKESPDEDNARFYYELRNQIVHHRACNNNSSTPSSNIDFDDNKWNKIISLCLIIIDALYSNFNSDLRGI